MLDSQFRIVKRISPFNTERWVIETQCSEFGQTRYYEHISFICSRLQETPDNVFNQVKHYRGIARNYRGYIYFDIEEDANRFLHEYVEPRYIMLKLSE